MSKAVDNVNSIIAPAILGRDPTAQAELDALMIALDGTENKGKLGANAILAVSMALCKAGAAERGVPVWRYIAQLAGNATCVLPVPSFNGALVLFWPRTRAPAAPHAHTHTHTHTHTLNTQPHKPPPRAGP